MTTIVTVIPTLTGGGAEKVCLRLHEQFLKRGIDHHIVVLCTKGVYDIERLTNIHMLPFENTKNIDLLGKSRQMVASLERCLKTIEGDSNTRISALFAHLDEAHWVVRRLPRDIPKRYVVHTSLEGEMATARRMSWLKHWRLKRKKLSLKDQHVIAVSDELAREYSAANDWLPLGTVESIHNPIDWEDIQRQAAQTHDAIPDTPYVIHIGRCAKAKRHDVLLAAFKQVRQHRPDVKLVLLTRKDKKLRRLLDRFDAHDDVIVPGFQNNPFPWIKQAQCLALSSDFEGLPNVLVESVVCGTPFVSTRCQCGPTEIAEGILEDWLVPMNDPNALAERLVAMLNEPVTIDHDQWALRDKVTPEYAMNRYLESIQ